MFVKVDTRQTRRYTVGLLELVEEGALDRDTLIRDLLGYLSESEVEDFVRANDLMPWLEMHEDEDEE